MRAGSRTLFSSGWRNSIPCPAWWHGFWRLGKLGATVGLAQVVVQAIGFISGILVIRLLSTQEYAFYTLANTMLGTMTILADGGISSGVMAQGGKVWQDRRKLGAVLATGLKLRKQFAVWSLLVATPVLMYLLLHHGASIWMAGLISLALMPAFFSNLTAVLWEIAPKLSQDILPLQRIQITSNLGRLALTSSILFIMPVSAIAILCGGVVQLFANFQTRKVAGRYASLSAKPDREISTKIHAVVRRVLPGAIYYCLSGHLMIWLLSVFGSTQSVAQVGALTRLAVIVSVIGVMFNTLVVPRFSRLPQAPGLLALRYLAIHAGLVALGSLVTLLVWIFPIQILWILGDEYSSLTIEVILLSAGIFTNLTSGGLYTLNSCRGDIWSPYFLIPVQVAFLALLVILIPPTSVSAVLWINILLPVMGILLQDFLFLSRLDRTHARVYKPDGRP